jgi:hypothetical protein
VLYVGLLNAFTRARAAPTAPTNALLTGDWFRNTFTRVLLSNACFASPPFHPHRATPPCHLYPQLLCPPPCLKFTLCTGPNFFALPLLLSLSARPPLHTVCTTTWRSASTRAARSHRTTARWSVLRRASPSCGTGRPSCKARWRLGRGRSRPTSCPVTSSG